MPDVLRYSELMSQVQAKSTALTAALITCVQNCPWLSALWQGYLPSLIASPTGTLCVLDSNSELTAGACCLWTVPAATTRAVFQIWGAGAGTGSPVCCGGAPYGQNGAYTVASIPVTAGSQFTLCAGAADTCRSPPCGFQTAPPQACKSFVTGTGLCNFCAEGACYNINRWICMLGLTGQKFTSPCFSSAGSCTCCNGSFTCDASCATCGVIGYTKDTLITWYGCATNSLGAVCGLPAMWGQAYVDTNSYGYYTSAPIVGICHTNPLAPDGVGFCTTFTSGTLCANSTRCASASLRCFPGLGGYPSRAMGGSVSICGDLGRAGMVRVTWC